jgi:hypothetical protein
MGRRRIALPTDTLLPSPLEASKLVFVSLSGSDLPAAVLLAIHFAESRASRRATR